MYAQKESKYCLLLPDTDIIISNMLILLIVIFKHYFSPD